jgi:hypothetical protein
MNINFDKNFLDWAVQLEDESNCDISAGIDLGQNVDKYLEYVLSCQPSTSSYDKILSLFQQKLGTTLPQDEIEELASTCLQIFANAPNGDQSIAA